MLNKTLSEQEEIKRIAALNIDYKKADSVVNGVHKGMKASENKILGQLMCKLLNRDPTTHDAKRMTRAYAPGHDLGYMLLWDNRIIGTMDFFFEGGRCVTKFIPVS